MLYIHPTVQNALKNKIPVVALESAVISHGLPFPNNIEVTKEMLEAVLAEGAIPAVIGLVNGVIYIGLEEAQLMEFSTSINVRKISRADIAFCLQEKSLGATTVSATMFLAHLAGIQIFSTGGLGGVHIGAENTFDVSADLHEFKSTPISVVCSGVKSILDIAKTLEYLETQGVPVVGLNTAYFPEFFCNPQKYNLNLFASSVHQVAKIIQYQMFFKLGGIIIANPIPEGEALEPSLIESYLEIALKSAVEKGITGKSVTPFLLSELRILSEGKTQQANISLLIHNAKIAAQIAMETSNSTF